MAVYLTRNPNQAAPSNVDGGTGPWQWFEKTYTSGTTQEAIYLPDINGASVTISFPSAGTASVESTDSPPTVIEAGNGVWVAQTAFASASSSVTSVIIGATAIRVNRSSGSPKISVRC